MQVFLGWSGEESKAVALALKRWLKMVCNAFDPWIADDIDKGARWSDAVAAQLRGSGGGVFVLTPEALSSPWIHFEAGAISNVPGARVCTMLRRVSAPNVKRPLSDFQHTRADDKEDVHRLVKTLWQQIPEQNSGLTEKQLDEAFDNWWPKLEKELSEVPATGGAIDQRPEVSSMVEEILGLVRELAARDRSRREAPSPSYSGSPYDVSAAFRNALEGGRVGFDPLKQASELEALIRYAAESLERRQGAPSRGDSGSG